MREVINEHTSVLGDSTLTVYCGWSNAIAGQLVALSQEDEIRRYTPKDASSRFATVETANDWYRAKRHVVYALMNNSSEIGGLFWLSYEPRLELAADYTIGIRMYELLRGKRLAGAFFEAAHADFRTQNGYRGNFWLITDADNERARQFYAKHGYKEKVNEHDGRVLMVRSDI
jgi:GNAT superfamily N-acetyltransferase